MAALVRVAIRAGSAICLILNRGETSDTTFLMARCACSAALTSHQLIYYQIYADRALFYSRMGIKLYWNYFLYTYIPN
jgi:hypothetical protein